MEYISESFPMGIFSVTITLHSDNGINITTNCHLSIYSVGTIPEHVLEYNWVKNEIKRKKSTSSSGKPNQYPASNIREGCEILLTDSSETISSPSKNNTCPERRSVQKDLDQIPAVNEQERNAADGKSNGKEVWKLSEKIRWLYCYETEKLTPRTSSFDDTARWKAFSKRFLDEFGVDKDNVKCAKQVITTRPSAYSRDCCHLFSITYFDSDLSYFFKSFVHIKNDFYLLIAEGLDEESFR